MQALQLLVIADLCFCEYTDHGHYGVLYKNTRGYYNDVDNDKILELVIAQAVSLVKAGADFIAPSGMMDWVVHAVRRGLGRAGFTDIPILNYAVKYASSFYWPFREAAGDSVPQFADRQTYQMNSANGGAGGAAIREVELDIAEWADLLLVKPAQMYLDIIYRVKQRFPHVFLWVRIKSAGNSR